MAGLAVTMRVAFYDGSMIWFAAAWLAVVMAMNGFGFGTVGLVLACVCGHR